MLSFAALVIVALGLTPQSARSQNLLQDDFTSVSVEGKLPYKVTSLGSPHITVGSETNEDDATTFDFHAHEPAGWTPSDLDVSGIARFGILGATLELSGGSALEGRVASTFHDIFHVAVPSGVAPGTPVTMAFVYLIEGSAEVIGLPDLVPGSDFPVVKISLNMIQYGSDGGAPPMVVALPLGFESFEVVGSLDLPGTVTNTVRVDFRHWVSIDVPFEYGVPAPLRTTLSIEAFTDNTFIRSLSNPYRELWGLGVVQSVVVDAPEAAQLVAVVNEAHPEVALSGVALDYSLLMTDTTPVPEPSAQALGAAAIAVVLGLARRPRAGRRPA